MVKNADSDTEKTGKESVFLFLCKKIRVMIS